MLGVAVAAKSHVFLLIKMNAIPLTIFGCLSVVICLHSNCVNVNDDPETLMNKMFLRLLRLPCGQQSLFI